MVRHSGATPLSEAEIEAHLNREGYDSFRWHDVPSASYPLHRHDQDECIWVLQGEIVFKIRGQDYLLQGGDRIYLPANIPHTAQVSASSEGVTYLVGQKRR